MSSFDSFPLSAIIIPFLLPVDTNSAETLRIPLTSMVKQTFTFCSPAGAGGTP
uniref:Uncharacterized protein n=1 Tax=Helianthus annuus TaxID=4232 RepID=A0A251UPA3_HELAN